jgi:hypothetical protein
MARNIVVSRSAGSNGKDNHHHSALFLIDKVMHFKAKGV